MVARSVGCPTPRLKLIRAAHALRDEDGAAVLTEGASLLAVVVPLLPSEAAQAQADPQPGEERVRASLEESVSRVGLIGAPLQKPAHAWGTSHLVVALPLAVVQVQGEPQPGKKMARA